jgi:hypothetical protein
VKSSVGCKGIPSMLARLGEDLQFTSIKCSVRASSVALAARSLRACLVCVCVCAPSCVARHVAVADINSMWRADMNSMWGTAVLAEAVGSTTSALHMLLV